MLNADTLIVGSYRRLTKGLTEVMARAVSMETGEIVWSSCGFFFQAEDGIRDLTVTGVQTCALPIFRDAVDRGRGGAAETASPRARAGCAAPGARRVRGQSGRAGQPAGPGPPRRRRQRGVPGRRDTAHARRTAAGVDHAVLLVVGGRATTLRHADHVSPPARPGLRPQVSRRRYAHRRVELHTAPAAQARTAAVLAGRPPGRPPGPGDPR